MALGMQLLLQHIEADLLIVVGASRDTVLVILTNEHLLLCCLQGHSVGWPIVDLPPSGPVALCRSTGHVHRQQTLCTLGKQRQPLKVDEHT
eukprot:233128-Chlamydomonas_euryale.AAC.1